MLTRPALPLLALVLIVGLVAGLTAAAPAAATTIRAATICRERGYERVTNSRGGHYVVKNDNYGGRPECIRIARRRPDFTVTRSGADSHGPEPMAYPFVLYGCSWGLCTPGSRLPARVRRVHRATASWSASERARGRWNAAFDIWFGRHRSAARTQARGAELMVWLNARREPAARSRIIRADHRRWHVYHWVTSHGGAHWTYIQVRAVRSVRHVRGLSLLPIIARMERMGLIRRRWWLLNIEAGFEIWRGGHGLATDSFSATVRD
jgi:cellulose 1,4-beta-cellobiosidase